ncbi:hypothetical protein [Longirhabdus pacifica]|uniref:hypothetical protein n=1 Tax=Longirhabdus pacifica TaxID=2305227 RepID=UPI0010091C12|nr:hypothetical protein [Longirhabdus pacifica]
MRKDAYACFDGTGENKALAAEAYVGRQFVSISTLFSFVSRQSLLSILYPLAMVKSIVGYNLDDGMTLAVK